MAQETQAASERRPTVERELSSEDVVAYLLDNPEFLTRHPALLKTMIPPSRWSGDAVVDIQRFMVDTLKEEMEGLRSCAQEVIETSRSNMTNQTRTHAAVLSLLSALDFEQLMRVVNEDLPMLLDVDVAIIGFESQELSMAGDGEIRQLQEGDVDRLLGTAQEAALLATMSDDMTRSGSVFGAVEGLVRSAALARLRVDPPGVLGFLALGSRHENAFHGGQGTELLRFLARVVERCLVRVTAFPR